MILPLLGKALLGAGKTAAKSFAKREAARKTKKIATDKFLNRDKKEKKTYSRPESAISPRKNQTISMPVTSNTGDSKSTEVKDILVDMKKVVGDIETIIKKDLEIDEKETKNKKFSLRRMFARAREKFLEKIPKPVRPNLKVLKKVPALQRLQKFWNSILVGSLLTFLYENMDIILQWVKGFIKIITPIVKVLVNIGKALLNMAMMIPSNIMNAPPIDDKELDKLEETYTDVRDEAHKLKDDIAKANQNTPKDTKDIGTKEDLKDNGKETNASKVIKDDFAPNLMNKGGVVPGTGNTDTVPAMLTPGEFVMSKSAVQQYGADTLAGMNAAAGGTNRPTMGRYKGGGFANITNTETTTDPSNPFSFGVNYVSPEKAKEKLAAKGMPSMELMDGTVVPNFGKMGVDSFNQGIEMVREGMANNPEKLKELDNFLDTNPYAQPDELQRVINMVVPGSQAQVMQSMGDDISASAKGYSGGGLVQPYDFAKKHNFKIEDYGDGIYRTVKITNPAFKYKYGRNKGRSPSLTVSGTYKQEDKISTEDFINNYRFKKRDDLHFNTKKLNNMLTDLSKSKLERGVDGLLSNISNLFNRSSEVDDKKSSSSGILGPISSNIDEMVNTKEYKPLEDISTYEEDFDNEIDVPIALPKSQSSFPSSQGGGMIPIPIGPSSRTLLNRYYKEQLLSFLYKV